MRPMGVSLFSKEDEMGWVCAISVFVESGFAVCVWEVVVMQLVILRRHISWHPMIRNFM